MGPYPIYEGGSCVGGSCLYFATISAWRPPRISTGSEASSSRSVEKIALRFDALEARVPCLRSSASCRASSALASHALLKFSKPRFSCTTARPFTVKSTMLSRDVVAR